MSWSADSGSITADSGTFSADGGAFIGGNGLMPSLVGLELYAAIQALTVAGILVPASIGYFGTYPITVIWQRSAQPPSTVLAQSIAAGLAAAPNVPITLNVAEFPVAVAFP